MENMNIKPFKIATFCDKGETRISKIQTYTRDYHPAWEGCKEYLILARNSAYAKHEAKRLRLMDEAKEATK
jgi:hypothetical protein